ncbi:MBL fold metallo-hydrolase (plasmid) [Cupriavidus necator]|uniref:MBL fold metallo-hydrolase n=1 Tax=Cupriavidus necator TaxID=106590 RepID=A0A367PNC6_CUPNE|nr:MBL fold metallo-hydrolase [Cupriavidus necator]QQX89643.1 MBL fold metallo-hydrolase [Cupriavidus necator]RCJ09024.1 MBL fold metallo-hydrolase [Cupriavidus necator]
MVPLRSLRGLILCCAVAFVPGVHAEARVVGGQAPGFYRIMVGEFEVTALSDGTNPMPATRLLNGDPGKVATLLRENFLGERVETSHNSYLINTGKKLVLIDAGAGALLGPQTGDLLHNLRAAGYRPEQVDEVYVTHLHPDHVGGLVTDGKRTFSNAIVRLDKREMEFWLSEAKMHAAPEATKRFFEGAMVSLRPYVAAQKMKPFNGSVPLIPGITSQSLYGHTPGHTGFSIESNGEKLLLWGDVIHVAAVQFEDPAVTIAYDVDAGSARGERRRMLADAAQQGYLIGGAHVPFPGIGHVRTDGDGRFTFLPVIYMSLKLPR